MTVTARSLAHNAAVKTCMKKQNYKMEETGVEKELPAFVRSTKMSLSVMAEVSQGVSKG